MKRSIGLLIAATLATAVPAAAQTPPNDSGSGVQRGIMQLNQSGQTGYITLYGRSGDRTMIVTKMEGVPAGRVQALTIHRGRDCETVDPKAVARGADLKDGKSSGMVPLSQQRLLSGNYDVIIFSNTTASAKPVGCVHLAS
jgi:hypothetical protein